VLADQKLNMQLILENALLSSGGWFSTIRKSNLFSFSEISLASFKSGKNPIAVKHRCHIEAPLSQGLADPVNARLHNGTYHLGISPHNLQLLPPAD